MFQELKLGPQVVLAEEALPVARDLALGCDEHGGWHRQNLVVAYDAAVVGESCRVGDAQLL